jgi:hypothetical protein
VIGLFRLGHIAGEDHARGHAQALRLRAQVGQQRPAARHQEPRVRDRGRHPRPEVQEQRQVLSRLEPSEVQDHRMSREAMARQEIGTRRTGRESGVDSVRHHRDVVGASPQLVPKLPARELAAHHHRIGMGDHPLLDHAVEPTGIQVMVVRDDRRIDLIEAARPEGGGADVTQ